MQSWQRFTEIPLPEMKELHRNLTMKDITDADYKNAKRVWEDFRMQILVEYHDLYVQGDTLLVAILVESFRNKYIKRYELDPAYFLSAPGLAWKTRVKKTKAEFERLTGVDMMLMVQKGVGGRMCHATHRDVKGNNKHMTDYDTNKESSCLMNWNIKHLYVWVMSQKLPMDGFK